MRRCFFSDRARVNVDLHVHVLAELVEYGHKAIDRKARSSFALRMREKSARGMPVFSCALRAERPPSSRMPIICAARSALICCTSASG